MGKDVVTESVGRATKVTNNLTRNHKKESFVGGEPRLTLFFDNSTVIALALMLYHNDIVLKWVHSDTNIAQSLIRHSHIYRRVVFLVLSLLGAHRTRYSLIVAVLVLDLNEALIAHHQVVAR